MSLFQKLQAWLLETRPDIYLRLKRMQGLRLGEHHEFLALHVQLLRDGDCIMTLPERYNLWALTRSRQSLPGAVAEIGVYRGGSARLLAAAKGEAPLHLFDTFQGMPEADGRHDGRFAAGQLADTSLAAVQQKLSPWTNVHFHAGLFPGSAQGEPAGLRYKLVHIDVDLRSSNLAALEFFYPRMVSGGAIVIHDYNANSVPGTKAAVDEFMRDKPELMVELWHTQVLLVKI